MIRRFFVRRCLVLPRTVSPRLVASRCSQPPSKLDPLGNGIDQLVLLFVVFVKQERSRWKVGRLAESLWRSRSVGLPPAFRIPTPDRKPVDEGAIGNYTRCPAKIISRLDAPGALRASELCRRQSLSWSFSHLRRVLPRIPWSWHEVGAR